MQREKINYFWENLLKWYENNKRDFPWRSTDNPFYILIAEFLLQQTHVRKVEEVYRKIVSKYPTPKKMAEADIDELKLIIQPLGLLYRAERLKNSAEILCNEYRGEVPDKSKDLLELPGVGQYISNSVLCYGFNRKTVPIDTNVIRLFCRYFNLSPKNERARNDKGLLNKIETLYSIEDYRKANLAVLDFSGTYCTKNSYDCDNCILKKNCSQNIDY